MDAEDFSSDTSDEDYVPDAGEAVSEEEESGDDEGLIDNTEQDAGSECAGKTSLSGAMPRKKLSKTRRKKRSSRAHSTPATNAEHPVTADEIPSAKNDEVKKKKADDLWADFMKDVGKPGTQKAASDSKSSLPTSSSESAEATPSHSSTRLKPQTVTVTKEYDFAGETVTVVKEVSVDSQEAKQVLENRTSTSACELPTAEQNTPSLLVPGIKRPSSGGLSSVLGKIGKKQKISVLEKSKIDWDGFKEKEGISDELKIHNRGKEGYLERQAFLQRTDYRQFEHERSLRLTQSSLPPTAKH